ncbi:helix-turn-helix domain-containing protein [Enterobacter hormaechei]|uniref:winged helix-turn-helix domain-containing protein n=1 Tax=Enterobacter hormaechei TaxID=158836 RepID=UPI0013D45FD3|nr:helix-turn-helix domain-containing protein [Enterobacter hormaechei]ELV3390604.1 helix-turn-helix domain-containing protein [Enterobacter hormaechei]
MDKAKSEVYGYSIGDALFYHVSAAALINTCEIRNSAGCKLTCIRLRRTMAILLEYLLANADRGIIRDNELISSIWEENGLKGSSARLWQVMSSLRKKLTEAGFSEEFIFRVNGEGYMLRENIITAVYCNEHYISNYFYEEMS